MSGKHHLSALVAAACAVLALTASTAGAKQNGVSLNMGAALRWHGWVETDLAFSEFFSGSHTIMARFMPQFTRAYRGPILGVARNCHSLACPAGPSFSLGQGDYQEASGGTSKLVLEIGGVTRTYPTPNMAPGTWQHVALRRGATLGGPVPFRLYLNGKKLCADPALYSTCDLLLPSPPLPIGTLRLGGTAVSGATLPAGKQQFYGLLDDVAVFKKALSADQIAELADEALHPRLTGSEANLYAGWTFDAAAPTGAALPAVLARAITYAGAAYTWPFLSAMRDDAFDAAHLPLARADLAMDLPFPKGEAWKITQGWDSAGSHRGTGAFALDAVYAGGAPFNQNGTTIGRKVYASAAGIIVHAVDLCPFPSTIPACQKNGAPSNPNVLQIRVAPGVVASYRHLGENSIKAAFGTFGNQNVDYGTPVAARAYVATVGGHPNGAHLHFGLRDTADNDPQVGVSFPGVYRNYEVWSEANGAWYFVDYGVPTKGQVVRVP